jgi:hypothetical protein
MCVCVRVCVYTNSPHVRTGSGYDLQLSGMLNFEGTEIPYSTFPRTVFLVYVSAMTVLGIKLYCTLTNKTNFSYTAADSRPDCVATVTHSAPHRRRYDWQCMSHAAAVLVAVQCRQFLNHNFKQGVIICSPGVKHARELTKVTSNTYYNTL